MYILKVFYCITFVIAGTVVLFSSEFENMHNEKNIPISISVVALYSVGCKLPST